ncbi:IclR family transcriptional regulator domain-containing protein [Streptomyces akebiae]|uniref:IclR family transcriptional regulator domain-containing protein n=1 Tax=Streptomyces akebiae TaxID=2865673 RepID=UPI00295005D3|nr:IclR family transcriptional regulator C-terminal domain-containing protein [Streptomyces akebiae]
MPDGREVVYRAEADPPDGALRLAATVGRGDLGRTTSAGKLPLAGRSGPMAEVDAWIGGSPPGRRTPRSLGTAAAPRRESAAVRVRGHGVDDQETEAGVGCPALPVFPTSPPAPSGAVSVSALAHRTSPAPLVDALDEIRALLGPVGEPRR